MNRKCHQGKRRNPTHLNHSELTSADQQRIAQQHKMINRNLATKENRQNKVTTPGQGVRGREKQTELTKDKKRKQKQNQSNQLHAHRAGAAGRQQSRKKNSSNRLAGSVRIPHNTTNTVQQLQRNRKAKSKPITTNSNININNRNKNNNISNNNKYKKNPPLLYQYTTWRYLMIHVVDNKRKSKTKTPETVADKNTAVENTTRATLSMVAGERLHAQCKVCWSGFPIVCDRTRSP